MKFFAGVKDRIGRFMASVRRLAGGARDLGSRAATFGRYAFFRGRDLSLAYWASLLKEKRTRFLTMAWAFCLIFAGMTILSESSPFRLLVPGLAFAWPSKDTRTIVTIYMIQHGAAEPTPVRQKLLLDESLEKNVERLALAVSHPDGSVKGEIIGQPEVMPDLGFGIRKVWFRKDSGQVLIDFRKKTIDEELMQQLRSRENTPKARGKGLDDYFLSLTPTIFSLDQRIKSIRYLIDGKPDAYPEMAFKLKEIQARK